MKRSQKAKKSRTGVLVGATACTVALIGSVGLASAGSSNSSANSGSAIERCLQSKGHTVKVGARNPVVMPADEYAREFGYGVSITASNEMAVDISKNGESFAVDFKACAQETSPPSPEAELRAAFGRLQRVLTADDTRRYSSRDEFVLNLPGGMQALQAWRQCVAARGVEAESPAALEQSIRSKFDSLAPSTRAQLARGTEEQVPAEIAILQAEERSSAIADLDCRVASLYPGLITVIDRFVETR